MAVADVSHTQDETAGDVVAAAERLLRAKDPHVAPDLVAGLFGHAAAEDLEQYEPKELAALAATAWDLLQQRAAGAAKVRLANPEPSAPDLRLAAVSVLDLVNDDMPFLLDSVLAELNEQGVQVLLVTHPIFAVERDADGRLRRFQAQPHGRPERRESFISVHLARIEDARRRDAIVASIEETLRAVQAAVADWRSMLARIKAVIAEMRQTPPPVAVDEAAEAIQFLEWLAADNFTFLGIREYALPGAAEEVVPRYETGLGILRDPNVHVLKRGNELLSMTPEIRAFLTEPRALIVAKANVRSRIHRRIYMDYVGVKRFDANGVLVGEFRIVGLFTSTAYTRSARAIPYLRRKMDAVLRRAGFEEAGHSGKALVNVLETYPRDDLFQIDEETLYGFALAIMQLDERPRVRVLARRDRFDRYVSALVYVPRERYDSVKRVAIGRFLAEAYDGRVSAYYPFFPEGPLVRVHFIVGRSGGPTPSPTREQLEDGVARIVRSWADDLAAALAAHHVPAQAEALSARYGAAFMDGYREAYPAEIAVGDIDVIERLDAAHPVDLAFYRRAGDPGRCVGLKVWSAARPLPLSARVPVLEHMGFRVVDERTFRIAAAGRDEVWLHDMLLEGVDGASVDLAANAVPLKLTMLAVLREEAESDGFNALTLAAGLDWREVALMRAIGRYLRQVGVAYSQDYLWTTLRTHAAIARKINALFAARLDPAAVSQRDERQAALTADIETALDSVASLDEDAILRRYLNAVQSTLRTNFFQRGADGSYKSVISLKFDSRRLAGLPPPRPLYEIFVYSPQVEGVHLRFGKVARGGIRWSDRPQDFRTEILGLVKAQQVKNAVIVPVGAKGGFVPKLLAAGAPREVAQAHGVAAYKLFISSLLDLTDNLGTDGGIVPPPGVVRHDGDDPYFVVAADKGTATFSDIANGISLERGFWLGDAFASGGSAGYDHKKMGITARGAWEAVKRHFRELDVDIAVTPFTVAGVGDMSGDVFGNGMLRERTIRLVAAFDHRDIFIDPDPDPAASFAERQRLFDLPRSSWQDYDKRLISPGGGVFSRSAKDIALSSQARALFAIDAERATPQQVMHAILTMRCDLLWFGGIGTYVRASTESDQAAGDRANDAIRASAAELRCKIIGEGANLGMTQRGRVEAAMRGVRLNTDAIDNSAGVNTSDVEVNIKIALSAPVRDGRLSLEARNALLGEMTGDVAALVLRNNYLQTLSLSLTEGRSLEDLGFQQRLMQKLEAAHELDRKVEFLPDDMEIAERRRQGRALTRPELAVLLAYAKLSLYDELLASSVPDDPYLARELGRYFPQRLSERFPADLERHRLRREIIATHLANSMINRGGPSLVVRLADQTGATAERIALAFAAARDSYGMTALNGEIDALDAKIATGVQMRLYAAVQNLLLDRMVWFLRHADAASGLAALVRHYGDGVASLADLLDRVLPEGSRAALDRDTDAWAKDGVPTPLARRIAALRPLAAATDIVLIADRSGRPLAEVAATYFAAGAFLAVDRLRAPARDLQPADYFDRLALDRALETIADAERRLTAEMVASGDFGPAAVEAWAAPRTSAIGRIRGAVEEILAGTVTPSRLTVAASMVSDLVHK